MYFSTFKYRVLRFKNVLSEVGKKLEVMKKSKPVRKFEQTPLNYKKRTDIFDLSSFHYSLLYDAIVFIQRSLQRGGGPHTKPTPTAFVSFH